MAGKLTFDDLPAPERPPCSVPGCPDQSRTLTGALYCVRHYSRVRAHGSPHLADIPPRPCAWEECGRIYQPVRPRRSGVGKGGGTGGHITLYCSRACGRAAQGGGDSRLRTCIVEGCDRPVRANDRCGSHYNQERMSRGIVSTPVVVVCGYCGKPTTKAQVRSEWAERYCGPTCKDLANVRRGEVRRAARSQVVGPVARTFVIIPRRHPARLPFRRPRIFAAGQCPKCGVWFVDMQVQGRFCSPSCGRAWHRAQAKIRRGYRIDPKLRAFVYARDHGVCQICLDPVDMELGPSDPWGPTLDHIYCRAWSELPDHSEENLRLAHRMCNSIRGDRG